jgi:hypothetical protein
VSVYLSFRYRSTYQSLRKIVMEEGVAGLYHGLWPTTLGLTINWAVYFGAYNTLKTSLAESHRRLAKDSPMNHLVSGRVFLLLQLRSGPTVVVCQQRLELA